MKIVKGTNYESDSIYTQLRGLAAYEVIKTALELSHDYNFNLRKYTAYRSLKTSLRRQAWIYEEIKRTADGEIVIKLAPHSTHVSSAARHFAEILRETMLEEDEHNIFVKKLSCDYDRPSKRMKGMTLRQIFCLIDIFHGLLPTTVKCRYGQEAYDSVTQCKINPFQLARREALIRMLEEEGAKLNADKRAARQEYQDKIERMEAAFKAKKEEVEKRLAELNA